MAEPPNDNRRSSIRRQVRLPFEFVAVAADASRDALCAALALPGTISLRARISDLDDVFAGIVVGIDDARTADALRALDRKVSVLEEVLLADLPVPAEADLELSADGVGFATEAALAVDSWVGIHLVLPVDYHVVVAARVKACVDPRRPGDLHRIGVEFQGLDGAPARRLTRFTISRQATGD